MATSSTIISSRNKTEREEYYDDKFINGPETLRERDILFMEKSHVEKENKEILNESYACKNGQSHNTSNVNMSSNIALKLNQLDEPVENVKLSFESSEETVNNELGSSFQNCSLETRATPKQVFPNIACLPSDNIIYCFVLSVWDNIVGPQTIYVWKKKSCDIPSYSQTGSNINKKSLLKCEPVTSNGKLDTNVSVAGLEEACVLDSDKIRDKKCNLIANSAESNHSSKIEVKNSSCKIPLLRSHTINGNHDLMKKSKLLSDTKFSHPAFEMVQKSLRLSKVVRYVTEHTVGVGEGYNVKSNKMTSFLLSVPHQNILILSIRFYITEDGVGVPYCFSAVIPLQDEHLFLPHLRLCTDSMYSVSAKIRLLISKEGLEAGDKMRGCLQDICSTLSSLHQASLDHYPLASLARQPDDRRMAERMLTSHLQTLGTTLVVADSPSDANRVVMWLAQFLFDDDVYNSRIALSDIQWPYQPGIAIQAVIRDASGGIDLSSSKLLASKRPLTLIDLSSNTVRQMPHMSIHTKNCIANFRLELLTMWHDLDHVPAPSQSLFETVETTAPLVKRFLHEWDRLASCDPSVKKNYLNAFLRYLQYSALSVIMWIRHEWTGDRRRRDPKSLFQAISSTFLLEESDLKIIFAQAERLEPGFMSIVYGTSD